MKSIDIDELGDKTAELFWVLKGLFEAGENVVSVVSDNHVIFYAMSPRFLAASAASAVATEIMKND